MEKRAGRNNYRKPFYKSGLFWLFFCLIIIILFLLFETAFLVNKEPKHVPTKQTPKTTYKHKHKHKNCVKHSQKYEQQKQPSTNYVQNRKDDSSYNTSDTGTSNETNNLILGKG